MCHITKKLYPIEIMIRFVLSSSNILTPDLYHEFHGKEFYVLASRKALMKMKACFCSQDDKVLQQDNNIVSRVDNILLKRIFGSIALARKAGKVVIGYKKIQRGLSINKIELLLQAKDRSEKSKDLILPETQKTRIECMNRQELGSPFKKKSVTNVGFLKSRFTNPLIFDTSRLESLRRC